MGWSGEGWGQGVERREGRGVYGLFRVGGVVWQGEKDCVGEYLAAPYPLRQLIPERDAMGREYASLP